MKALEAFVQRATNDKGTVRGTTVMFYCGVASYLHHYYLAVDLARFHCEPAQTYGGQTIDELFREFSNIAHHSYQIGSISKGCRWKHENGWSFSPRATVNCV